MIIDFKLFKNHNTHSINLYYLFFNVLTTELLITLDRPKIFVLFTIKGHPQ